MSDAEIKIAPIPVNENEPGLMLTISKQTSMTGEVISVATNLSKGWTREQLSEVIDNITFAIDKRLSAVNEKVLARTGKNLEELYLARVQGEA